MIELIAAAFAGYLIGWAGTMMRRRRRQGNGNGGPSTPKPPIKPQPSGGYLIREGNLWGGYHPRPQRGESNPPPEVP